MEIEREDFAMVYDLHKFVDRMGTNSIKWEFMNMFAPEADEETIPMWFSAARQKRRPNEALERISRALNSHARF